MKDEADKLAALLFKIPETVEVRKVCQMCNGAKFIIPKLVGYPGIKATKCLCLLREEESNERL